jgi:hypothetical protein
MDEQQNRAMTMIFAGVLLLALTGVMFSSFSPDITGQVSTYQQVPLQGGVQNQPDPGTQYYVLNEGFCKRYATNPAGAIRSIDRACQELNHGRQSREAACRYQAQRDAELDCRPAPVFGNVQQPMYLTGMVTNDPLGCANLAGNYDSVIQQTLERAETPAQTVPLLNPCTHEVAAASRQMFEADAPLRTYARASFADGSFTGYVQDEGDAEGDVRYVSCPDGTGRVFVSGTSVCNTLE